MNTVFGNAGLKLASASEIAVDRKGLWSGSCRFTLPIGAWSVVPKVGNAHPLAAFLLAERSRVILSKGLWQAIVEYAGIEEDESEPQYALDPGVGNEPIETHDDFVRTLAGRPSAPINGALFKNPKTGWPTRSDELGYYEFEKFAEGLAGGAANPFAGTKQFLECNQTVWTKTWTSKAKPEAGRVLSVVDDPPGGAPSYGGAFNWLEHPVAYTKRGGAYSNSQRWLLSARRGWNRLVYPN